LQHDISTDGHVTIHHLGTGNTLPLSIRFRDRFNIQNYCVSGLCTSSRVLNYVSETGSLSVLGRGNGDGNSVGSLRKS
jgi:hypothetical protein